MFRNCRTIHGKSRYPGLNIWPRNESEKLAVRVPDGCLLVRWLFHVLSFSKDHCFVLLLHNTYITPHCLSRMEIELNRSRQESSWSGWRVELSRPDTMRWLSTRRPWRRLRTRPTTAPCGESRRRSSCTLPRTTSCALSRVSLTRRRSVLPNTPRSILAIRSARSSVWLLFWRSRSHFSLSYEHTTVHFFSRFCVVAGCCCGCWQLLLLQLVCEVWSIYVIKIVVHGVCCHLDFSLSLVCGAPISEHPLFYYTYDRPNPQPYAITRNIYILLLQVTTDTCLYFGPDKTNREKKPKPNGQREQGYCSLLFVFRFSTKLASGKEREMIFFVSNLFCSCCWFFAPTVHTWIVFLFFFWDIVEGKRGKRKGWEWNGE